MGPSSGQETKNEDSSGIFWENFRFYNKGDRAFWHHAQSLLLRLGVNGNCGVPPKQPPWYLEWRVSRTIMMWCLHGPPQFGYLGKIRYQVSDIAHLSAKTLPTDALGKNGDGWWVECLSKAVEGQVPRMGHYSIAPQILETNWYAIASITDYHRRSGLMKCVTFSSHSSGGQRSNIKVFEEQVPSGCFREESISLSFPTCRGYCILQLPPALITPTLGSCHHISYCLT